MKRLLAVITFVCCLVGIRAQGDSRTVTFWDSVRNEPYGSMLSCYDKNGNDLIFDVFERAFPVLASDGSISLHDTEKIKTMVVVGKYFVPDTIDVSAGIPDTIRFNHGDWPPYKFLGYYVPVENVGDTAFTRGFHIDTYGRDSLLIRITDGNMRERKVLFKTVATLADANTLTFECNGTRLAFVFKDLSTLELRAQRHDDEARMPVLVKGCPLKPCTYKRKER